MNARTIRSLMAGLGLIAAQAAVAQQRLPDPPPEQPTAPPMPEKAMNIADFVAAYKRAASPRFLIYTDLVGASSTTAKHLDDSATVTRLGARLEDLFRDPEVQIVNPGAMEAMTDQQVEALRRNDALSAAKALAKSANADVVLYVRLIEKAGDRSYTGTYVLADMRRGTSLGRFAWDMVPGPNGEFDSARMTEYARAIARRAIDQFSEAFPVGGAMANMRRFVVRVLGQYEDDDLAGFRDALNGAIGVKPGSVMLRSEDKGEGTPVATFELSFSGDLVDLRRLTRRVAIDQMAMEATPIDAREGSIGLKLSPLSYGGREKMLTGGAKTQRNAKERERLTSLYEKAGRPRMAVVINRPTVEAEASLVSPDAPKGAANQAVSVIVGERVTVGEGGVSTGFAERLIDREVRDRREAKHEDAVIDMRVFEDKIAERLLQLGLLPRDVSAAQTQLSTAPDFKDRKWTDRELAFALGKAAGVDIVVSGVGRVVRENENVRRIVLTMHAYNVGSGDLLAATSVQQVLPAGGESYANVIEEMAAEATSKLVVAMSDRWEAEKK